MLADIDEEDDEEDVRVLETLLALEYIYIYIYKFMCYGNDNCTAMTTLFYQWERLGRDPSQ